MKIPTIKRRKWHRKGDRWQVTNESGATFSCNSQQEPQPFDGLGVWHCQEGGFKRGADQKPPKDWTTTLRRIVTARKGSQ